MAIVSLPILLLAATFCLASRCIQRVPVVHRGWPRVPNIVLSRTRCKGPLGLAAGNQKMLDTPQIHLGFALSDAVRDALSAHDMMEPNHQMDKCLGMYNFSYN
jgi:hypothetical protein